VQEPLWTQQAGGGARGAGSWRSVRVEAC